MIGGIYLILI